MKKILFLGAFGYRGKHINGQTIKTRNIYEMFKKRCSPQKIDYFDTQDIKYSKVEICTMIRKILSCEILIYLPAQANLKFFFPFVYLLSKIKNISIIYVVVGGWLADFLSKLPLHRYFLRSIKKIFVQTNSLKDRLEKDYKFLNVDVLHNFRSNNFTLNTIAENKTLKLVFMARINKLKGLETIFSLAEFIMKNELDIIIDFYGPVFEGDRDYFKSQVSQFKFISYKGILDPEFIYEKLSEYDLLLLPTKYFTEGFPGSILDAYISGIPVIVTNWMYAKEFVDEGKTGYIVSFDEPKKEFKDRIIEIYTDRSKLSVLKANALRKSNDFSEKKAWDIINKLI